MTHACHALAQDDYNHFHNQVANIFHQELAMKFRLLKAPPMLYYKCEPQSVLEDSIFKLHYDRFIIPV
jgi:hypothetical protein